MDSVKFGLVSAIDYKNGMISVTYPDRDSMTTKMLPYLQLGGEYHMPMIEQKVVVLHLSTGVEVGVCVGPFWDNSNPPTDYGKDVYHKEMSNLPGSAYIHHDPETRTLRIKASNIILETESGDVDVSDLIGG